VAARPGPTPPPRPGGRTTWDIVARTSSPISLDLARSSWSCCSLGRGRTPVRLEFIFITPHWHRPEMRAKIALDRLSVLTAPAAIVLRDARPPVAHRRRRSGRLLRVTAGDQIVADGETWNPEPGSRRVLAHGRNRSGGQGSRRSAPLGSFVVPGAVCFGPPRLGWTRMPAAHRRRQALCTPTFGSSSPDQQHPGA